MTINTNIKINYENNNLLEKIIEIEKRPSPYTASLLKSKECPAFRKTNFLKNFRQNQIEKENLVSHLT